MVVKINYILIEIHLDRETLFILYSINRKMLKFIISGNRNIFITKTCSPGWNRMVGT